MIICPRCSQDLYYDCSSGIRFCEFCSNKLPSYLISQIEQEFFQVRQELRARGLDIKEPEPVADGKCTRKFHRHRAHDLKETRREFPADNPKFCYRCGMSLPKV